MRVLVSHPHAAAVSASAARALADRGALAAYATGIAAARGTARAALLGRLARAWPVLANRIVDVPGHALAPHWGVELAARAVGRGRRYDAMFLLHDAAVAATRWPAGTDAIYAYEDGALRTFRRARALGLTCVWDLPLPHWATLERIRRAEMSRWPGAMGASPRTEPGWKKRRKDDELALADVVSVASRFTRESLEEAACPKRVVEVPYGFPAETFRPATERAQGPFTILAVGTHDLRKGTPYLLEAWRRAELRGARLRLVGPLRLAESFLRPYRALFEHVPHLPRVALESEYQRADLLAFPTLGDGFGLVMQEAMCCATPVLTTRCGGGPECITDGVDGWIAPERDVEALVDRFREAARDRDRVREMGRAARLRAERWTGERARRAFAERLERALDGPR